MSKRVADKQAARVVREQLARERRRRRTLWTSVTAALVLLIAGLIGYGVYASREPAAGYAVPASTTADQLGLKVGSGPVTVEIYLDYLCPACRSFEEAAQPTLDRYLADGRVTLVFRVVSILDRYSTNQYSTRSGAGAGCAADAGKVVEYTKALYARQPAEGGAGHTDDQIVEIAAAAGITGDTFGQCVRAKRYAAWVAAATSAMDERGVTGTPTVFVDGRKLADNSLQSLTTAVEAA